MHEGTANRGDTPWRVNGTQWSGTVGPAGAPIGVRQAKSPHANKDGRSPQDAIPGYPDLSPPERVRTLIRSPACGGRVLRARTVSGLRAIRLGRARARPDLRPERLAGLVPGR
ncbi:hypothetical protein GCM10010171_09480 [Actinokineospora fastidiosa]|uniref:Uncharacterized protein n=1 Tax=Actinokineospora fastidiosa TaxID=1816 RepID=A0A918G5Z7_9PSEU|nr:hypothetical protein GCM10010171_09480 [Actinokineospora fastidiosa]